MIICQNISMCTTFRSKLSEVAIGAKLFWMCTPFYYDVEQDVEQEQNGAWGKAASLCL